MSRSSFPETSGVLSVPSTPPPPSSSLKTTADSLNFYVAAPARTDPSVCPAGSDAIMVLVPCPSIPDDFEDDDCYESSSSSSAAREGRRKGCTPDRGDWVRRAREGVIREMEASAGMEGFGESIVGEEVYAPWDWRDR